MNKWIRRVAGTVGVAGGMLLLGAGAAHADSTTNTAPTPGLLDDLFSPTGGPNNLGLSLPRLPLDSALPASGSSVVPDRVVTDSTVPDSVVSESGVVPGSDGLARTGGLTKGLPLVGGLPLLTGHLPVPAVLPVVGQLTGGLPLNSYAPRHGAYVPRHATADRQAVADDGIAAHSTGRSAEALPLAGDLPLVNSLGGLTGGASSVPLVGNLMHGGGGLLPF
jgi:hypothetical protein